MPVASCCCGGLVGFSVNRGFLGLRLRVGCGWYDLGLFGYFELIDCCLDGLFY